MKKGKKPELSTRPRHEKLQWPGLRADDHFSRVVTQQVKEAKERNEIESWAQKQISLVLDYISAENALKLLVREARRRRKAIPNLSSLGELQTFEG